MNLTILPKGQKTIGAKWVYKAKEVIDHKAILMVKENYQRPDIDHDEVIALVDHMEIIRLIISLVAQHQMDVKSSFLNGYLEEKVYIEQSLGYKVKGKKDKILKLKKILYGLIQISRAWYSLIDKYF